MSNPFIIRIGERELADYKAIRITYSMERAARTVQIELADKWFNSGFPSLPFQEGDPLEVFVSGRARGVPTDACIFIGYIDDIPIDWDMTSSQVLIVGSSRVADLVDCSATHATGSWRNTNLNSLALDITSPFAVGVVTDKSAAAALSEPFAKWAIEDQETAFDCIKRAAKMRGVFVIGDEGENIVLTRSSAVSQGGTLALGINVKKGHRSSNYRQRHSEYTVKSQRAGSDTEFGELVGQGFFTALDPEITRHRPKILMSDGSGRASELKSRAEFERNTRAGKSRKVRYDSSELWNGVTLEPWKINRLITVLDPKLDINGLLLLEGVDISYGPLPNSGSRVSLQLIAPEAYNVLIPPKPRPKGTGPLW